MDVQQDQMQWLILVPLVSNLRHTGLLPRDGSTYLCVIYTETVNSQITARRSTWITALLYYRTRYDVEERVVTYSRYSADIFLQVPRKITKTSVGIVGVLPRFEAATSGIKIKGVSIFEQNLWANA